MRKRLTMRSKKEHVLHGVEDEARDVKINEHDDGNEAQDHAHEEVSFRAYSFFFVFFHSSCAHHCWVSVF
jgi:hypothetical protein